MSGNMDIQDIQQGEHAWAGGVEEPHRLVVRYLGEDLAVCIYSPSAGRIAILREADPETIADAVSGFLECDGPLHISLLGASNDVLGTTKVDAALQILNALDDGTNRITIIAANVQGKQHPDSFYMDAKNGVITAFTPQIGGPRKTDPPFERG